MKIIPLNRNDTIRGVAHSKCNLNYKVPKDIPIIIHNATYEFKGELLRKNKKILKQLHVNLGLLIVLDLCRLHYQNLLIICLGFLIV